MMFRDLVRDNPMLAESKRVNSQLLRTSKWTPAHTAAAGIGGAAYVLLLGYVIRYSDAFPGLGLIFLLLTALVVLIPVQLHGVIAGEREKRSLEMLLAAPVTSGQIIVAKAARALGSVGAVSALILSPTVVLMLAQTLRGRVEPWWETQGWWTNPWLLLPVSVLILAGYSFFSAGVTIYLSARSKTAGASLLSAIGVHLTYLLFLPFVYAMFAMTFGLMGGSSTASSFGLFQLVGYLHPVTALQAPAISAGGSLPSLLGALIATAFPLAFWFGSGLLLFRSAARLLDQERRG